MRYLVKITFPSGNNYYIGKYPFYQNLVQSLDFARKFTASKAIKTIKQLRKDYQVWIKITRVIYPEFEGTVCPECCQGKLHSLTDEYGTHYRCDHDDCWRSEPNYEFDNDREIKHEWNEYSEWANSLPLYPEVK